MADRFCKSCGVSVSEDLSNCPLCGKYLLGEAAQVKATKFSYPQYNFSSIQREKALKIIKNLMIYAGIICILVNLIFITEPLWFPLTVVPLFCLYMIFIHPFRHGGNLIKNMPSAAFFASVMLIFIDAYNALCYHTVFGWAFAYAVPMLWVAVIAVCAIVSFCSSNYASYIARQMPVIAILSVVYLIIKLVYFTKVARWPSLVWVCVALAWLIFALSFRKKFFADGLKKDYHIN